MEHMLTKDTGHPPNESSHSIFVYPARKFERDSIAMRLLKKKTDKMIKPGKNTKLNDCLFSNHTCTSLFLFISCIQHKKICGKYFDDDTSTHTMDFASMKHGFKGKLLTSVKNIFLRHNFV